MGQPRISMSYGPLLASTGLHTQLGNSAYGMKEWLTSCVFSKQLAILLMFSFLALLGSGTLCWYCIQVSVLLIYWHVLFGMSSYDVDHVAVDVSDKNEDGDIYLKIQQIWASDLI